MIVYHLMKSAHFLAFRKDMEFSDMSKLFVREVTRLYGTPVLTVSDRDSPVYFHILAIIPELNGY